MAVPVMRWVLHAACHVLGHQDDDNRKSAAINEDHLPGAGEVGGAMVTKSASTSNVLMSGSSCGGGGFQMPLHYPRYSKADYEKMEEWRLDMLLRQYGLCFPGTLDDKRAFAVGTFLWPHQY